MLNVPAIRQAMTAKGLTQGAIATACDVSKEAVSNWLSADAQPRPRAVLALAEAVGLPIDEILVAQNAPMEPVVAFRTRRNRTPSAEVLAAAREMGEGFARLLPYVVPQPAFRATALTDPQVDHSYVDASVVAIREKLGHDLIAPISVDDLIEMHRSAGAILVPVLWGGDKAGHENALHIYLPDSTTSWVVINLNCRNDDFKFWLAHELGHVYSLHRLRNEDGEDFSERFAASMLFPQRAAALSYERVLSGRLAAACAVATEYDVSPITIVREIDRYARSSKLGLTRLDSPALYQHCLRSAKSVGTVAQLLFGSDNPQPSAYVEIAAQAFGTSVFEAISTLHKDEGVSPSYIASVLNVGLADAASIYRVLAAV